MTEERNCDVGSQWQKLRRKATGLQKKGIVILDHIGQNEEERLENY